MSNKLIKFFLSYTIQWQLINCYGLEYDAALNADSPLVSIILWYYACIC